MNFPLFIDLKDKEVLIVGAGAIAARRATVLVEFGAKVTVVAPEEGRGVWTNHVAELKSSAAARGAVSAQSAKIGRGKIPLGMPNNPGARACADGASCLEAARILRAGSGRTGTVFSGYRCHQ